MAPLKTAMGTLFLLAGSAVCATTLTDTDELYAQECECEVSDSGTRTVPVVIRDFKSSHPDFENPNMVEDYGIVQENIGDDGRPVYAPEIQSETTSGEENFNQWYRDVDGVNYAINKSLTITEVSSGFWRYSDSRFFPIDGEGFGNERNSHNYHFTLETHLKFYYVPGGTFTFRGDDDLFLFINGKLAMDIGGIHNVVEKTLDLDAMADYLGIEPYNTYSFDLFFAERHTVESNFQFETTLELECL